MVGILSFLLMDLDQLLFDDALQRHIIGDAARDVAMLSSTRDSLIGEFSMDTTDSLEGAPLRPAFIVDFCKTPAAQVPTLNFDDILSGPPWARLWLILTLIAVSPSLFEAIRATSNPIHRAWLLGASAPLVIPSFRERYFKSLCGSFNKGQVESNCKTPIEIVTSELFIYSLLKGK